MKETRSKQDAPLLHLRRRVHRLVRPMARTIERVATTKLGVPPSVIARVQARALGPAGPALVRVVGVTSPPASSRGVLDASLGYPTPGASEGVHALRVSGAVVGRRGPATAVEATYAGQVVGTATVRRARPDLAKRHPSVAHAAESGFRLFIGTVGLPATFEIELQAVLADDTRVPICAIQGARDLVRTGYQPTLRPIMLTTIGRSGGTWLMRLLSEHPHIVIHREYPYEMRTARYWAHLFKVLSDPADQLRSAQLKGFMRDPFWVGRNPFYPDALANSPDLVGWFGRDYIEQLGAFCPASIDRFYQQVAISQRQAGAVYFAEKFQEDQMPVITWELFPDAREIMLVRDFRDVAASKIAFEAKQLAATGKMIDPAELSNKLMTGRARRLAQSWTSRSDKAHLIRYEHLIREPNDTLGALLAYLDLDASAATIDGILRRASKDTFNLRQHRTTESPEASIGRWQRDLDPPLQTACTAAVADSLAVFGYEA